MKERCWVSSLLSSVYLIWSLSGTFLTILQPVKCTCQKSLSNFQDIFRSPAQWTLFILPPALQESDNHMVWNLIFHILIRIGKSVNSEFNILIAIVRVMVQNLAVQSKSAEHLNFLNLANCVSWVSPCGSLSIYWF